MLPTCIVGVRIFNIKRERYRKSVYGQYTTGEPKMQLDNYIGQTHIVPTLEAILHDVESGNHPGHICFTGGAGLGKTHLAQKFAAALGLRLRVIDSRTLKTTEQLRQLLTMDRDFNDIFFFEEIHGFDKKLEEPFYEAMDTFKMHIMQKGKVYKVPLFPFILIGATTRWGEISAPLRSRFRWSFTFHPYSREELSILIQDWCHERGYMIDPLGSFYVASLSRGNTRYAKKLTETVLMFHRNRTSAKAVVLEDCEEYLLGIGILPDGSTPLDRKYIDFLKSLTNRTASVQTIAASLGEEEVTLVEVVEPFLLQTGRIVKTSKGRQLVEKTL